MPKIPSTPFILATAAVILAAGAAAAQTGSLSPRRLESLRAAAQAAQPPSFLKIDYPFPGSVFPPDMVPPSFLFHDGAAGSRFWFVEISIPGGPGPLGFITDGRRPAPETDPRCGLPADYRESEALSSAAWFTPEPAVWDVLVRNPEKDITVTVYGLAEAAPASAPGPSSVLSR